MWYNSIIKGKEVLSMTKTSEATYTEADLRKWFAWMRQNYKNCPFNQYLIQVEDAMFDPLHEKESLENFKKGLDKPANL